MSPDGNTTGAGSRIHDFVLRHGAGRDLGLTVLGLMLCFAAFYPLTTGIHSATGHMPFDNQFPLTPAMMAEQLTAYGASARNDYLVFFAVDMVFPPLFSLFFALLWARALRRADGDHMILALGLLWLPFVSAGFDWLENFGNLWVIYGGAPVAWYWLPLTFKYAKLGAVTMNLSITMLLWIGAVRRR